jgi:hypothetical protein
VDGADVDVVCKKRRLAQGVLGIMMGDYVENLAVWAVGACNVATFLDKCF